MVMESIIGPMVGPLMDNGGVIKFMDMVSSPGLMAENMKDTTSTTRKMAKAPSHGPTADSILVAGRMAISMDWAHIIKLMVKSDKENGMLERESDGLKNFNQKRRTIMIWSNSLILMTNTISQKRKLTKMTQSFKWIKR